jgi:ribosome recycling factor
MDLEDSMRKSVEATQRNFNTIRTGRANPSLLDKLTVEYYGAETGLKSLATLSTPDAQTIQIQPFDASSLPLIEKAIAMSDLGLTPNNDGRIIRINIPLSQRIDARISASWRLAMRRRERCRCAIFAEKESIALKSRRKMVSFPRI